MTNGPKTGHRWKYDSHISCGVPTSVTLIVAHKIAVMDLVLHEPLYDRLDAVSDALPITCRVWLIRALKDLDDEGFVRLTATVDDIMLEVEDAAIRNKIMSRRSVKKSQYSMS